MHKLLAYKLSTFTLVLGLLIASGSALAQVPPCDELAGLADALDGVAETLQDVGEIPEGSQLDQDLGEIIDHLEVMARAEQDAALNASISSLGNAWNESDWDLFRLELESVILSFDRIYYAQCPG